MDSVPQEEVFQLIIEGKSYKEISEILQHRYPNIQRGFSERSVRRYVAKNGLKSEQRAILTEEVRVATQEVSYYTLLLLVQLVMSTVVQGSL